MKSFSGSMVCLTALFFLVSCGGGGGGSSSGGASGGLMQGIGSAVSDVLGTVKGAFRGGFSKTYSGLDDNISYSIQQTTDGGYIVAGETYSFGAGFSDIWVLKLGSSGAMEWQKAYGGSDDDIVGAIQQTADGGYIVAGETYSFGAGNNDMLIFKINNDGTVAWQRTYGGAGSDAASSIQQTADGGYIVAGYTTGGSNADAWVLKLGSDGAVAWQKAYGGSGDEVASSVRQTADGGYIVAGFTRSFGSGNADAWVLKLGSDGTVAWQKAYGGLGDDVANSIQPTEDGGFVFAGHTSSFGDGSIDAWLLKLNSSGEGQLPGTDTSAHIIDTNASGISPSLSTYSTAVVPADVAVASTVTTAKVNNQN